MERMSSEEPTSPISRTLVLLRHGKSAYPPGVDDHQRPLAPRGRREAALAGTWIETNLPPIDHVICSTAERTRQTLQATGLLTPTVLVDFTDAIYEAYPEELLGTGRGGQPHRSNPAASRTRAGHPDARPRNSPGRGRTWQRSAS